MASDSIHEVPFETDVKDDTVPEIQEVDQEDREVADPGLKRSLKSRHMQMLAIGGVIGPGYFVGIGSGFTNGGPAGLLLGFGIVGILLWVVMQSLGEMAAFLAVSGSFTNYTSRFLDPALGFSLGWNYDFLWFGILAAEYNNLGLVTWECWLLVKPSSFLTATKLIFIFAFFVCSILITSGAIGNQGKVGFKYYNDPGAFADGVTGVFKVFVFAALQYSGTEMIGLTAGESANPARDVPKAVRFVFWRVLVVFLGGIFFLSLCVPWNDPGLLSGTSKTARSPFVISFVNAGLPRGGDAVNAIIIVTILSALNGALYVSSRCVSALAHEQKAPKFLGHINKRGVPTYALVFCNLFGFISLLNLSSSAGHVYSWLVNITGVATFITWGGICWAHIRFRKAMALQGLSLDELPFKAAFYPYGAYIGLFGNLFFIFFQGWTAFLSPFSVEDFFMNYIMIPVFAIMYLAYKLWNKTKWVDLSSADLVTGRREIDPEMRLRDMKKQSIGKRIATVITG